MPIYSNLGQVIPVHVNWHLVIAFWLAVAFGPAVYGLILTGVAAVILRAKQRALVALGLGVGTIIGMYFAGLTIGFVGMVFGLFTAEWQLAFLFVVCVLLGTIVIVGGSVRIWVNTEWPGPYPLVVVGGALILSPAHDTEPVLASPPAQDGENDAGETPTPSPTPTPQPFRLGPYTSYVEPELLSHLEKHHDGDTSVPAKLKVKFGNDPGDEAARGGALSLRADILARGGVAVD